MTQGMENSLGFIYATPLQRHGKKLSEMGHKEDGIDVRESSGSLRIVNSRQHPTVISQIKEGVPDRDGPHG